MKVYTLDNELVKWQLHGISSKDNRSKSSLHEKARELLHDKHPTVSILEEVAVPVRRNKSCYLDFYIPLLKTAIECQGKQHFEFTSLFHANLQDFIAQKKRDMDKSNWCDLNNIQLISLRYDEVEKWKELL